jgi:hypothetical protein
MLLVPAQIILGLRYSHVENQSWKTYSEELVFLDHVKFVEARDILFSERMYRPRFYNLCELHSKQKSQDFDRKLC